MSDWRSLFFWVDLVDIATVGVLLWLGIRFVRRTRGRAALSGLLLLVGVYLLARTLDLRLTAALFQGFFAVLVLVFVVVFQEDLRRLFEQLGSWRRRGPAQLPQGDEVHGAVVRAVSRLAATRTGALLVLPGREPIESHVEGGVALGGRVSEPLLLSIFDSSSPGHDGAALLRDGKIEHFALHLPLSANHSALGPRGTRHAAALGLAERCDATCIVVSEERGTVSIARDGEIRSLARPEQLASELRALLGDDGEAPRWWKGRAGLDAALAVAGALALWLVFVPGSVPTEVSVRAPVRVSNLPTDLELESIDPPEVDVTLRGIRRRLVFSEADEVALRLDATLAQLGRRTFALDARQVQRPDGLTVVSIDPDRVKLSLRPLPAIETPPPAPREAAR